MGFAFAAGSDDRDGTGMGTRSSNSANRFCTLTPCSPKEAKVPAAPTTVTIEHPMGDMDVLVDYAIVNGTLDFRSAGVQRTARLIAKGEVLVPSSILEV